MKHFISILSLVLIFASLCSCTPEKVEVRGESPVEGQLSDVLELSENTYMIDFEKDGEHYNAVTTLKLEVKGARDLAEVSLSAALIDADDEPVCMLELAGNSMKEELMSQLRSGAGSVELKFSSKTADETLSKDDLKRFAEKAKKICILRSEGSLAKTPEQIKAERDSIARASVPAIEITDLMGPKRKEEGYSGSLRDMKSLSDIVSALEAKGFTVAARKSRQVPSDFVEGMMTINEVTLNRMVGEMKETVKVEDGYAVSAFINFCDNVAASEFMSKMTADGYKKDGTSSDCYYAGSYVERYGKNVTLRQIWEP